MNRRYIGGLSFGPRVNITIGNMYECYFYHDDILVYDDNGSTILIGLESFNDNFIDIVEYRDNRISEVLDE